MALLIVKKKKKKKKNSEFCVPFPGPTKPLSLKSREKKVNRTCQRCLGFKSIVE